MDKAVLPYIWLGVSCIVLAKVFMSFLHLATSMALGQHHGYPLKDRDTGSHSHFLDHKCATRTPRGYDPWLAGDFLLLADVTKAPLQDIVLFTHLQ